MKRPSLRAISAALARRAATRAIGLQPLLGPRAMAALIVALAALGLAFLYFDPVAVTWQRGLPGWLVLPFRYITHLGWSGTILWPVGIALPLLLLVDRLDLGRAGHGTLAAVALRLGLVFTAVALPGLVIAIVKRVIGRLRPPEFEIFGHLAFDPMAWKVSAASFPSGHATTAFAAAVVLGALWPRARLPLFLVASLVALSRVVLGSHYASDAIGGAILGTLGAALIVRAYARRRLALKVAADGTIEPMSSPSACRLAALAVAIRGALRGGPRPRKNAADERV